MDLLRVVHRPGVAAEKPRQPLRDVDVTFLCTFERVVIVRALLEDAARDAVEAAARGLALRQRLLRDRTGDASVPVLVGMDREEP